MKFDEHSLFRLFRIVVNLVVSKRLDRCRKDIGHHFADLRQFAMPALFRHLFSLMLSFCGEIKLLLSFVSSILVMFLNLFSCHLDLPR